MTQHEPGLFGESIEGKPSAKGGPTASRDEALVKAYAAAGRTLDDLPYTREFETLVAQLGASGAGATMSPREAFHRLHTLRKAGKLPRAGRAATESIVVQAEEEELLSRLVVEAVGTLGQRDQLPFTPGFDRVLERFNAATGRGLDGHGLWRLIAKIAK